MYEGQIACTLSCIRDRMYTVDVTEDGSGPVEQVEEHFRSRRIENVMSGEQSRVHKVPVNCRKQRALSVTETNPKRTGH